VFHAVGRVHDTLEGDTMDVDLLATDEAAARWQARRQQREVRRSAIDAGRISEVESPERIKKRLDRLTEQPLSRMLGGWTSAAEGLSADSRSDWSKRSAWSGSWDGPIFWA
jgi:hypothetical protein